jgi:NAD(P)-dependent dehydrogenase (short-subunit alcohol dehydrogenase family)
LLHGRLAVVTGASSGIGAALSEAFAGCGARVALVARRQERLVELASRLGADRALAVQADVADFEQVRRAERAVRAWAGDVHVLANCAGVYPRELPVWELAAAEWTSTLAVNATGVFHTLRVFLPGMIAAGYGRILNVSSEMVSVPFASAYSVSKTAVDVLTEIAARELASIGKDFCVNSVDPGSVVSEMNPDGPAPTAAALDAMLRLATLPKGGPSGQKWRALDEHARR